MNDVLPLLEFRTTVLNELELLLCRKVLLLQTQVGHLDSVELQVVPRPSRQTATSKQQKGDCARIGLGDVFRQLEGKTVSDLGVRRISRNNCIQQHRIVRFRIDTDNGKHSVIQCNRKGVRVIRRWNGKSTRLYCTQIDYTTR